MLQPASTTRKQYSQGLKRCGSESSPASGRIQPGQKSSLGLFVPVFLAGGISPDAPCPPACEEQQLGPSFFCAGCLEFHPQGQHRIDRSKPPLPVNPEDRALSQIREWQEILEAGGLDRTTEREIRGRIERLRAVVSEWSGQPTQCTPDSPGGIGTLKAKSVWGVKGLDFTVQAWSKGEATAQFSKRLRAKGEKGRFSVSISNPQRVK